MVTPDNIKQLQVNQIFVFGSNTSGRHGKGAALYAKEHFGAQPGVGEGMTGQCYAIPTRRFVKGKGDKLLIGSLGLSEIRRSVEKFKMTAKGNPGLTFLVTPIGCGYAGYMPDQIAPMFSNVPKNVALPLSFLDELGQLEVDV